MSTRKIINKLYKKTKYFECNKIDDIEVTSPLIIDKSNPNKPLIKLDESNITGGTLEEKDTLKTVTDRENITDVPIKLRSTRINPTSGAEESYTLDLHYNSTTSNLMLTNDTETYLQDNGTSTENIMLGIYNLYTMGTLKSNILYGYYPIRNIDGGTTNLTDNIIIGNLNLTKAPALGNNIVIGKDVNIGNGNYLTDPDTTYYPIWGDFISGNRAANAWGNTYTESNHKDWLISQGIINEEGKSGPFSNIFIGRGIGPNRGSSTPANSYQSIWIGHNSYPADFAYKFCGNIFLGNEIYPAHPRDRPAGAVIIGNYLKISGRHTLGELAIHSSSRTATDWNDALIRGNFETRYVKFNGKVIINPTYHNAEGDITFSKQVVAKPDGTLGLINITTNYIERVDTSFSTKTIEEVSVPESEVPEAYKYPRNGTYSRRKRNLTITYKLVLDKQSFNPDTFKVKSLKYIKDTADLTITENNISVISFRYFSDPNETNNVWAFLTIEVNALAFGNGKIELGLNYLQTEFSFGVISAYDIAPTVDSVFGTTYIFNEIYAPSLPE